MNFLEKNELALLNQNSRAKIFLSSPDLEIIPKNILESDCMVRRKGKAIILTTSGWLKRNGVEKLINKIPRNIERVIITVPSNPELNFIEKLRSNLSKSSFILFIIAVGGGSVLDTAKVLSALLYDRKKKLTVSQALQINIGNAFKCIPVYAVPTTSGTGAEVTPFATIWDFAAEKKFSLENLENSVKEIYLIPELTLSCPKLLTLNCALDTCSHAMETLWNRYRTEKSVKFALKALDLFNYVFEKLLDDLLNVNLRKIMQFSTLWAGLAISINHTALAHALSYELTIKYGIPHGIAASCTLRRISEILEGKDEWLYFQNNETVRRTLDILNKIDFSKILNQYGLKNLIFDKIDPVRAKNFILDVSQKNIIL